MLVLSVPHDLQGGGSPQPAFQDHQLTVQRGHIMETLVAMARGEERRREKRREEEETGERTEEE